MKFNELNIMPEILKALESEHYAVPTPIQEKAIPLILNRRDLLGCAQTGTGKTAAFAIPTIQLLSEDIVPKTSHKNIRALIITPTRELALQIHESFCTYGKYTRIKSCAIFGGVSQKPQEEALQRGVDILVATPGRLSDLMNQRLIDLSHLQIFILDEADRMLDMGFINDVKKIIAKIPVEKQTLLFSATMPPAIAKMSSTILRNPARVEVTPVSSTVDIVGQYLYYVDKENKKDLLLHILQDPAIVSALVFTRTKHGADRIIRQLAKDNVTAQAIHGDKSQGARQQALNNFKNKTLRVLVATDIAARGIDIDELSHVINFDLPNVPETYVHRIGRTGRAGLGGIAISLCDFDEKSLLIDIEKLIGKRITEVKDHPFPLLNSFPAVKAPQTSRETSRTGSSNERTLRSRETTRTGSSSTSFSKPRETTRAGSSSASFSKQRETTRTNSSNSDFSKPRETTRTGSSSSSFSKPRETTRTGSSSTSFSKPSEARTGSSYSSFSKPTSPQSSSLKGAPQKKGSSILKKVRMTADGELKEKKSLFNRKFK